MIIENCSIGDATVRHILMDASNVTIKNNDLSVGYGAFMLSCQNDTVSNDLMSEILNEDGVYFGPSHDVQIRC